MKNAKIKIFLLILLIGPFVSSENSSAAVLFEEKFENTSFASRNWYDISGGAISSDCIEGSGSFECRYNQGGTGCASGGPGRHLFEETDSLYLSYYVKYSSNFVGSALSYHPHEIYFVTNKDGIWIGPAGTHLTVYVERNRQKPRLAMQDMLNVDTNCIRRNNGLWYSPTGASNCSAGYPFTEVRSVCSCNGIVGSGIGDCFQWDSAHWYSAKMWDASKDCFGSSGQYNQNNWNHIEAYFKMNSIQGGIGIRDGQMKYWFNGELVADYSDILYRTGANADMKFNQFILGPYIGDGSPVLQYMWIDDLKVGTERENTVEIAPASPRDLIVS